MWNHAKLVALWALKQAKYTETDFGLVCLSYASVITVSNHFGNLKQGVALEVFAFEVCHRKKSLVELEELKAVVALYRAIFVARFVCYFYTRKCIDFEDCLESRLCRAEVEKSIHIGYLLWRIASSTHMTFCLIDFLPTLVMLIVIRKHLIEAGNIMQELCMLASQDVDISGIKE